MKASFVTLLALPFAFAAPSINSAREVVADHLSCTCTNAAGETRASGICQARIGSLTPGGVAPAGEEWCYSAVYWALPIDELFPASLCGSSFPNFPTRKCQTFRFDDGLPCEYSSSC